MNELELFIRLKYFPLRSISLSKLPEEVLEEYHILLPDNTIYGLEEHLGTERLLTYIEEVIFNLLLDYYIRHEQ